jgi:hypothetical protein
LATRQARSKVGLMKRRRRWNKNYNIFFFTTFLIMVALMIAVPPLAPLTAIVGTFLIFVVWARMGIWKK